MTPKNLTPQDLLQNRSLETVPICIVWQCFPHDNIVCYHMCDMNVRDQTRESLSQALVHFVIDRASLFTDHRRSGLPIRAKYKYFTTI